MGGWSGSPTIYYAYQWELCDAEGASCSEIADADTTGYTARRSDVGHTLRVALTASNAAGSASVTTAPSAVVAAPELPSSLAPPVFPRSRILPGEPEFRLGEPLLASEGRWTGDPEVVEQWQRCDPADIDSETGEPVCADIPGAIGLQYTPQPEDIGYYLRVEETATNAAGSASTRTEISPKAVPPFLIATEFPEGGYTGAAVSGQTITAYSTVVSTPELPVTTSYEFLRVNPSEASTVLQAGSSSNYTLTGGDLEHEIEIVMVSTIWRSDHAISVGQDRHGSYPHCGRAACRGHAAYDCRWRH